MKYSIIIPYRDRRKHLDILLPELHKKFASVDYEIIVSEQNDDLNFRIACVENIGAKHATGDILVFQQVDYVPTEDVSYETVDTVILPHRRGIFLTDNLELRDESDIPSGYRQWSKEIDENFYGGVVVIPRHHFYTINGFNPLYIGWGNEDEDLRERLKYYNIPVRRNSVGTFRVLNHKDNCPSPSESNRYKDFIEGRKILQRFTEYLSVGVGQTLSDDVQMEMVDGVKWVKSANYTVERPDLVNKGIVFSSLEF